MDFPFREPAKSHIVTINSGTDNSNNFVSYLPQTLKLPRGYFDVGCLELKCFKVGESDPAEDEVQQEKPQTSSEEVIRFPNAEDPEVKSVNYIYETKTLLVTFIGHFNTTMKNNDMPVRLSIRYYANEQYFFDLEVTSNESVVVVQEDFASMIGMQRRAFTFGVSTSEFAVTKEILTNVPNRTIFRISHYKFSTDENLILYNRRVTEMVVASSATPNIDTFIANLVREITIGGYLLTIEVLEDKKIKITFATTNHQDEYFVMPTLLMQLFGFDVATFHVGTYISSLPYDETTWERIIPHQKFLFEFSRYHVVPVAMEKPSGSDYSDVLGAINKSFETWNFDQIRPQFFVENGKISLDNIMSDVRIKLPALVASYFGLPRNTVFTNGSRFQIKSELIAEEKRKEYKETVFTPTVNIPFKGHELLVLLDIVENQIYGGRVCPVLIHTPWDFKTDLFVQNSSVTYLPLNRTDVSEIRVTLVNEKLEEVNLKDYVVVVRLHFKPRTF